MTNKNQNVLYTGITNDLLRRAYEHRTGAIEGFTKKYRLHSLVYFEVFNRAIGAIEREKQIKAMNRIKKNELISAFNRGWNDLFNGLW